jgi:DNA-binding NtrC family response regulator
LKRAIFYIDDEAVCLSLFQERFGGEYDVRTAATLSEARRMLEERPADIVISDQSMPEIKGTDFLSEVAKTHPQSYRVLLTGSIGFGEVIPEIGDGTIHFFLPKPWTEEFMRHMFERASVHLAQQS